MLRFILPVAAFVGLLISPALAQERPVVVELFTSQGCSSCPPADAYLHELAGREDVIALALHVDYWDYIGWKDSFADPAFSKRQRGYASAGGRRMVYTPQMIINGSDHVVGNRPRDVEELISAHASGAQGPAIDITARRAGDRVSVTAAKPAAPLPAQAVVQLFRYTPKDTVDIRRGENAGRQLSYANIVTGITVLQNWDGRTPLSADAPLNADQPAAIVVQAYPNGPVIGAARVE